MPWCEGCGHDAKAAAVISRRLALLLLLGFMALMALCAWRLLVRVRFAETVARRLRALPAGAPRATEWQAGWAATLPAALLGRLLLRHQLLPRATLHEAELLLAGANLHGQTVLAGFVGGKVLLLAGLPPLGWAIARLAGLAGHASLLAAVAGAAVALVLPDLLLGRRRRGRLAAIARGLPDALDLLVICIDAGLAFEHALERVTREIAPVHPELAQEFAITVSELRLSPDRRAVLLDMGARLDVDFLRQLAATLAQSLQLGAPLSRALRLLSQELRQEQMLRVETRAARLPVLLTIPMVLFIMPAVLVVVCGPAVVQILRTF
jgi:tight adherence protein C